MLYNMLTQSSNFQSLRWSGSKAGPNMVSDMVPKSRHSIEMFLRPYLLTSHECLPKVLKLRYHPDVEISLHLSNLSMEISQLAD